MGCMNADAPVPTGAGDRSGAGRFAPSPTSQLHLGNLRTALLAWLFARAEGLRFLVRIEDLDQARVAAAPGVADQQLRDLAALGLDWDGPVLRQSGRNESIAATRIACPATSASAHAARSPRHLRRRMGTIAPTRGPVPT